MNNRKSELEIIEIALEEVRHRERMYLYNKAYEKMYHDKTVWEEEIRERAELEGTINDGLNLL